MIRAFIRMTCLFALVAGCDDEPCYYSPTTVVLQRAPSDGGASTIRLHADASGRACGCCGGRPQATIVGYAWDLNGDGIVDQAGATLSDVELSVSSP